MKNEKRTSHRTEVDKDDEQAINLHRTKLIEAYYGIDDFDFEDIESIKSYPITT